MPAKTKRNRIKELFAQGLGQKAIVKKTGCSYSYVGFVLSDIRHPGRIKSSLARKGKQKECVRRYQKKILKTPAGRAKHTEQNNALEKKQRQTAELHTKLVGKVWTPEELLYLTGSLSTRAHQRAKRSRQG